MQFTRFIRKVFATTILLSGKFFLFLTLLPGSWKTIIGAEIARRLVEKTKEETGEEPVVIITNVSYKIKEDSPPVSQLKSRA